MPRLWTVGTYLVALLLVTSVPLGQNMDVQLASNKSEYICGEPVLLETSISNPSRQNFKGSIPNYGWGRESGFTMYLALAGEDFEDILSPKTRFRNVVSAPPRGWYDFFDDRHWLPQNLSPHQKAERLDMLIFPKPGDYRLKAVLKEPDGTMYTSEPIQFRVLPLKDKPDSLSRLGGQDFLINLGSTIFYAHYVQKILGGYSPGESLNSEKFEALAPAIIEKYKDSVFREYVLYADILTHGRPETSTHELIEGRKELAERFLKEYANSWLLPDLYRRLFWTYVGEKDRRNAERILAVATKNVPDASVLREVRQYGPARVAELPTSVVPAAPLQSPDDSRLSFPGLIVIAAACGLGLAFLAVFLVRRRCGGAWR